MIRVPYQEVFDTLFRALLKLGFKPERAQLCARLFTDTSRDGVYSHGLERFPRFVRGIRNGLIDIHATAELVSACGPLERWNGRRGPGNLNAHHCMERAIALSRAHSMGCVALANTNHWMRGGSYGWQAADAGVIGICWTNTMPNLPPSGASDPRVGNNPCHNFPMARWPPIARGANSCPSTVALIQRDGSLEIQERLNRLADRCQSGTGKARACP